MSNTPRFDRFGWYWQPQKWLNDMSSQDAITATTKATGIDSTAKVLQQQATRQQAILKQLWDDD